MKRGTYAKNLLKKIKVRIDEATFKITELSEEAEKNTS
jgi:hypothetical protein